MSDLSTDYLGLRLDNPLVPSASPLSRSLDSARQLEDAGAGALVMYSLFEEEISAEDTSLVQFLIHQETGFGEADSFLPLHDAYRRGLDRYLEHLRCLKEALSIPVIASLNGVSDSGWVEHGRELEQAGADALELNIYYLPGSTDETGESIEARYVEILRVLRDAVSLPVSMKLSPQFTALPSFVQRLQQNGANGVCLFHRFYQPDIDLDTRTVTPKLSLSDSQDTLLTMRWIAILHGRVDLALAASGGVHTAEDALKMLMAGADIVNLASALLKHGPRHLAIVRAGILEWLEQHEHASLDALRGCASQQHSRDPAAFERANYLWVLDNINI